MNNLTRLKYLNLEYTVFMSTIPVQVISNLSKLQVLNMFFCGSPFYDKVKNNVLSDGGMLMKELVSLKNLSELSLTVMSASFLHSICSIKSLLNCMHALCLCVFNDTKSLNISSLANAKQLHLLHIYATPDLEELIVEERETHVPSCSLNNDLLIFCGLLEVNFIKSNSMRHMTWLIFAPHLTILRARENEKMEEIISAEKLSEYQARGQHFNLFPKLQVLDLDRLPKLKSIYTIALSFPHLTQIEVRECPALRKLPLNSESAEGCNVVIRAEECWWNELTWEMVKLNLPFRRVSKRDNSSKKGKSISIYLLFFAQQLTFMFHLTSPQLYNSLHMFHFLLLS